MLRVHFTERDLVSMTVASEPDPLWETVLGLHQFGGGSPLLDGWRRRVRANTMQRGIAGPLRFLHALAAPSTYFPDFLTPEEGAGGLCAGLDAVRRTSRVRLRDEVRQTARTRSLPSWAAGLARAEKSVLDQLADALRRTHDALVAPYRDEIDVVLDPARQRSARAFLTGGIAEVLGSLSPGFQWQLPVLSCDYPREADLYLDGRGIRLIPSYFCWRHPVVLADPTLTPVLVYPVQHGDFWTGRDHRPQALYALLGQTRAKVLERLGSGANTTELATRVGVAPASASEHLRALRDAGLVRSQRAGQQVRHELTGLGEQLRLGVS